MRINVLTKHRPNAHDERGFTLVITMALMLVSSLLVAGALSAASGNVHVTQANTAGARAYSAAQAGIQVFEYNINKNFEYWLECPKTAKPIPIPGEANATYSYEVLPATGHATCEAKVQASIIETKTSANGTFRLKATGEVEHVKRSIVATLDHPGFLNFVFLSDYEVEDPSTFAKPPKNCEHYYLERKAKGYLKECPPIPFIGGDELKGPFHTNDAVSICSVGGEGSATFGRNKEDEIQMNEGNYQSENFGCGNSKTILGKYVTNGPTLNPPATDNELLETAEDHFVGRTVIELKGEKLKITNNKKETEEKPFPSNGVIFVENQKAPACAVTYSPFVFDTDYETDSACGDVYVKGFYSKSLTIASAQDVIIYGNTYTTSGETGGKPTGEATLGLVAQNFVRVYHPVKSTGAAKNTSESCEGTNRSANESGVPLTTELGGANKKLIIDAAILSTKNSFIVDNFACGTPLGELIVWGAIAQFWRGRVTQGPVTKAGYAEKNYNYDERLKYKQPPNFLSPSSTGSWKVARETAPTETFTER